MRCDAGGKTIEAESARCRLRRNESSVKRKGFVMYNYEWENGAIIRKRSEESEWQVTKLQKKYTISGKKTSFGTFTCISPVRIT